MKLIEEIIAELKAAAIEFTAGETNKEEFNLKIDLLIGQVERIEINFVDTHINTYQSIFNQLLYQRKHSAVEDLKELQLADRRQVVNTWVRRLLESKLYFTSIYRTITANMYGYQSKHGSKLKSDLQIFRKEEEGP
jgi:hypothetical protein